jgi:hypothetical protein
MNLTRKSALLQAVALLLILMSYAWSSWPALSGPFVFDDFPNLQNLEILGNDVSGNLGHYLASYVGSPGRPISALSFLINDNAWPSEPFSFKYTNLMIHLLNGVLLFGLLRQLAKACPALPQNSLWPLLAMAAWLFHPLQLSTQMLVVQRMTLLSATFCFIGLWGYVALLQRAKSLLGDFTALCFLGACTILAFLCKENGILLPLYAWALNTTLLKQVLDNKNNVSRRFVQIGTILPSLLVLLAILDMARHPDGFVNREFTMQERLMTQMHVLADYLRHIFIPRLTGSGIYFDDYPLTRSWTQPISTLLLGLGFMGSIVFAIAKRKRFPILSFAILWFFAGHCIESTILNLELFFEHRNYMPLLGPVLALSVWAFSAGIRLHLGIVLLSLWILLLCSITALQAPVWGNNALMATLWAKERPLSLRAAQELAKYRYDSGDPQAALNGLMQAYDGGIRHADLPMAGLLVKCWTPSVIPDRDLYQESLKSIPTSIYSNSVLSSLTLLREATEKNECDQTIDMEKWLRLSEEILANPKFLNTSESNVRVERARAFIHKRDLDLTMANLERAYVVKPSVEITYIMAEVLISAGLIDEAETWLKKGMKLKQPLFDTLMYDPKNQSRKLIELIQDAKQARIKESEDIST